MYSHLKRAEAARLLATGMRKVQVARQTGIALGTLQNWSKEPDFLRRVGVHEHLAERRIFGFSDSVDYKNAAPAQSVAGLDLPIKDITEQKLLAALLIAKGGLTTREIAGQLGVSPRTVARWKHLSDLQRKVAEYRAVQTARHVDESGTNLNRELRQLNDMSQGLWSIIEGRRHSQWWKEEPLKPPGADTGLVYRRIRSIGGTVVVDYPVDIRLLRAMQRVLKTAAILRGEWKSPT